MLCHNRIMTRTSHWAFFQHPVSLSLGVVSLLTSLIFIIAAATGLDLLDNLSVSFLPGKYEYIWCAAWFLAGLSLTTGIIKKDKGVESIGWVFLSSVCAVYSIAAGYKLGLNSLLIISLIPALAIGSLVRFISMNLNLLEQRDKIKTVKNLNRSVENLNDELNHLAKDNDIAVKNHRSDQIDKKGGK